MLLRLTRSGPRVLSTGFNSIHASKPVALSSSVRFYSFFLNRLPNLSYVSLANTIWHPILNARGMNRGETRNKNGSKSNHQNDKNTSSSKDNTEHKKSSSDISNSDSSNEKPDPSKEFAEGIKKRFAVMLFLSGILYMILHRIDDLMGVVTTNWTELTEKLLPSGEIDKIVLFPNKNAAYILMHPGARSLQGEQLERYYYIGVPSGPRFEAEVRAAEAAMQLPPEQWTNIKYNTPTLLPLLLLPLLLISGFLLFKTGKMGIKTFLDDMMMSVRKPKYTIIDPHSPEGKSKLKIKFSDVAGCHEAKVEIKEFMDWIKNPIRFTKLGAKLPKGALLTGPPGCGKTLLAKALATESTCPFISMNGSEFVEVVGGLGASRMRGLFSAAKEKAPCIIYIDEIDAIGRKRKEGKFAGMGNSEQEQTLNQLLVEMDGIDSAKGIVVIASTNRPKMLDKALLRRGRFDRHIEIDLPTLSERKELFEMYLKKISKDFSPERYSQRLAMMTPNMTGADIGNVVNEAAIYAASHMKQQVTIKDVEHVMDRVIAGREKRSRSMVQEEREVVAYHEAGHALVGWMLQHTDALLKVTIVPRTSAALGFAQYSPQDKKLHSKEELFDKMCMMLGGRVAEDIKFGTITTGAQNDLEKVTRSAYAQVKRYGMSAIIGPLSFAADDEREAGLYKKPYSKKLQQTMDQESSLLVGKAYKNTENILRSNRDKLELIARGLLEREVLSYEDIKKLIGPPPFGEKSVIDIVEDVLPQEKQ